MVFGTAKEKRIIKFNGSILQQGHETKYLVLYLNDNLNWREHTENIAKKVRPIVEVTSSIRG